jgi:hypothetical protein
MTPAEIARLRLLNQHIDGVQFTCPEDLVAWLCAVQSQEYAGAKWALGLRLPGAVDAEIERAFASGAILRTHVMRPTWHFVAPADIRWMLALTAPRVHAISDYQYRKAGLDDALFARSADILTRELQGGHERTRDELRDALERDGVATQGPLRLGYIMMRAELEGLICSGPRRGKQFTYALLEERVPPARTLERAEALAELTRRYFTSHGPATARDFSWWSGLTVADAQRGLEIASADLQRLEVEGRTYWTAQSTLPARATVETAHLLPNYDEYGVSYQDRSAIFDPTRLDQFIFSPIFIVDGQIAGAWKRMLSKRAVTVELNAFISLANAQRQAVTQAAERYAAFLGLPTELVWLSDG